jgi:hypothetical protein
MKHLLSILVLLALMVNNAKADEMCKELLVYNYPSKDYSTAYIRFICLDDSVIKRVAYTFYFTNRGIKKMEKSMNTSTGIPIKKTAEGNLKLEANTVAHTAESYKHNTRMATFMELLSKDFLELDNQAKYQLIDSVYNSLK